MLRKIIRGFTALAFAALVSVAVLVAGASLAYAEEPSEPTLKAEDVTAKAGDSVEVKVEIKNNPGILGATFEVSYDSSLTLTKITNGEAFKALEMTKPGALVQGCRIHWDATELEDADVKDGTAVTLTFVVADDAAAGDSYFVSVSPAMTGGEPDVFDRDLNTVELKGSKSNVVIEDEGPVYKGSVADAMLAVGEEPVYTGSAQEPKISVVLDDVTLVEETDYTVAYANNTNAGTATATVTGIGSYDGEQSVQFNIAKATQTITASDKFVAMGKTVSLGAKASGGGKLTYKSSSTKVATVSSKGVVTPKAVGTATITITAAATTNYAAATKTVSVTVTRGTQTITASDVSVKVGAGVALGAKASAGGALTFTSADESIAAVDAMGTVTGVAVGTTTIDISAGETASYGAATASVTVTVSKGTQTITAADKSVAVGKTVSLGAKASGGGKLTYKSSSTKVATVSSKGVVTGKAVGTATITIAAAATANYEAATKTVTITVTKGAQTVTASDIKTKVGESVKIDATASAGGELTYASGDESVATVDASGAVTGVSAGNTTITITADATAGYSSATKTITVTVAKGVQTITATNKSVAMGKTVSLGAKSSAGGKLTYKSSSTKIATVSTKGVVTPKAVGTATITITAAATDNYESATKTVKVTVTKGTQAVAASDISTKVGETTSVGAKASGGGTLSYVSSDESVATVDEAGVVTGVAPGEATVVITADATANYNAATKSITVTVAKGTQTITAADKSVAVGKTVSLGAKASGGGKLTYKSSSTKVATVSSKGVVTGKAVGTATITITAAATANYEAATKTVKVTVTKGAQTVTVSDVSTKVGESVTLAATSSADGAISYASANKAIATVDNTGTVTGIGAGSTTITVTAAATTNYESATKTVTVTVAKGTQSITASDKSVEMGKTISLGAKASGGGKLSYKSSSTKIAKVSAAGVVTPVKVGKVTITITAAANNNYEAATAKVTVTVTQGVQTITASDVTVKAGETVSLGATSSAGSKLTYKSSDVKIATVAADGTVTGVTSGTATITITAAGTTNYKAATKTVTVTVTGLDNPFIDVTEATSHYDDILWLASEGISGGWDTAAGKEFRPNANVKRGDMAAFLFRLAKKWGVLGASDSWKPSSVTKAKFTDVSEGTAHSQAIWWMAENGISSGWDVGGNKAEFRPNADVKRGDLAAFLGRLANKAGRAGTSQVNTGAFIDVSNTTSHCEEIWWMAANGISGGWDVSGGKEFRPNDSVKRGDMAAFLHRLDGVA